MIDANALRDRILIRSQLVPETTDPAVQDAAVIEGREIV
jgi:hypothetical protein